MDKDILVILDSIERERGIKKEVLIEAVESALISAAKKTTDFKTQDISVKIDRTSGEIKFFSYYSGPGEDRRHGDQEGTGARRELQARG